MLKKKKKYGTITEEETNLVSIFTGSCSANHVVSNCVVYLVVLQIASFVRQNSDGSLEQIIGIATTFEIKTNVV